MAKNEAPPRVLAVVTGNVTTKVVQFLKLPGLADFVDDSVRGLGDKTTVECCAVEVSVRALHEPTPGIAPVSISRDGSATDKGMEQRELPLRGDLENRAVTALDAAVAV